ncbi:MAG: ADP-ribose pyrophosphatase [Sphingobacteriales bacterium]
MKVFILAIFIFSRSGIHFALKNTISILNVTLKDVFCNRMNQLDENHNPWQKVSSQEIYDNPWIKIDEHQVINPKGNPGIYGLVHFKNLAIGVLPIFDDGSTMLVGQYRYPLKRYSWEIPEGGGPLSDTPLESAKRELLEECGLKAKHWEPLLEMDLSNSVTDEHAIIFLAKGLSQHEACPEDTEELTLKRVPFQEAFEMVMNGKIQDTMSVAAIMKYKLLTS